jgi:hypothetical protein
VVASRRPRSGRAMIFVSISSFSSQHFVSAFRLEASYRQDTHAILPPKSARGFNSWKHLLTALASRLISVRHSLTQTRTQFYEGHFQATAPCTGSAAYPSTPQPFHHRMRFHIASQTSVHTRGQNNLILALPYCSCLKNVVDLGMVTFPRPRV